MAEYIHTAIIVTGRAYFNEDVQNHSDVNEAQLQAISLGLEPSDIVAGANAFDSFMIAPSGSAGGLHRSHAQGADARSAFVDYLRKQGTRLEWVEVTFGREHGRAEIGADCTDASSSAAMKWNARTDPRRAVPVAHPMVTHSIGLSPEDFKIEISVPKPTGVCFRCEGPVYGEAVPGMPCVNCTIEKANNRRRGDHE